MDGNFYVWGWLILGAVLMAAELIGTDFFLFFLGLSAIVTGILAFIVGDSLSMSWQISIFCILALCSTIAWYLRHIKKNSNQNSSYQPNIGLKGLVGRNSVVESVESDNTLKIIVNDSVYIAFCENITELKVGQKVKIVDFDESLGRLIVASNE